MSHTSRENTKLINRVRHTAARWKPSAGSGRRKGCADVLQLIAGGAARSAT